MRLFWLGVIGLVLCSCSTTPPSAGRDCSAQAVVDASMLRGTRDGAAARQPQDLLFLDDCASGSSAAATQAYRDSFASARAKRMRELADAEAAAKAAAEAKARGAGAAWMCEVEASSKIFTGTGRSREEALGSARSTCGSHVEASYCSKAECKKTM